MGKIREEIFVCFDCETTGLDPEADRIVEIAGARFTFTEILDSFDYLVNPEKEISAESIAIHHITPEMVKDKPTIEKILPDVLHVIGRYPIVGHGVGFDIALVLNAAKRANIPCSITAPPYVDTLRLARHYGDSPNNSLENLAAHFNIPKDGAHRAMNDVIMNIEVFKRLVHRFITTEQLFNLLSRPIKMKFMPLGKHKGRPFSEIPLEYLKWASHLDFDQDLLYTIHLELKKRKTGKGFTQATNPFASL